MKDLEINKALALAIGWRSDQVIEYEGQSYIGLPVVFNGPGIKLFDYRFASVIWLIAERYSLFPSGVSKGDYAAAERLGRPINDGWECLRWHYDKIDGKARGWVRYTADTAAKAVALAVIGRKA
jgi:hypothetical protein